MKTIIIDNVNIQDSEIQEIIETCIGRCRKDESVAFSFSISQLPKDLKEKFLIYLMRNFEIEKYPIYITEEMEMEAIIEKWKNAMPKISEGLNALLKRLYETEKVSMLDIYTKLLPIVFQKPEYYNEFYNLFPNSIDMDVYEEAGIYRPPSFNSVEAFNSFYRNKRGKTYTNENPVITIGNENLEDIDKIIIPPYIDTLAIHMQDIASIPAEKLELLSQKVNLKLYFTEDNIIENHLGYGNKKRYYYTFQEFKKIKEKIEEIIKDIDPQETQLEKFLKVYKKLGKLIEYDYDENGEANSRANAHNLKGALLEERCVCEGYALALKQVLKALDINCKYISDFTHGWNQVEIDGVWYNCDLTWDAPAIKENRQPDYCLKSDDEFINHSTNCSGRETCNQSQSFINEADRLVSGNFNAEYLQRELQYLCRREKLPLFQKEKEIFKKAYEKQGLDFEKDYEIAQMRVALDRKPICWDNTQTSVENEMKKKTESLGLDIVEEIEASNKRKVFRECLEHFFYLNDEKGMAMLQKRCANLGLNFDYELYMADSKKKPIALYIEDGIKSMALYISKNEMDRIQDQLLKKGKNSILINNEEERID